MSRVFCLMLAGLFLLLSGCSAYYEGFHYSPHPAIADIPATQPQAPPPVSVMASIVGIHRDDQDAGIPESVEVAMRIENNSQQTVTFDPQTLKLTNGLYLAFRPAQVHPPTPVTIPPMQTAILGAYFPFPPEQDWGDADVNWLQLSWMIQIDGQSVRQVVNYQRIFRRYYYYDDGPYYYDGYPRVWVGGEFIVRGRRR